LEIESKLDSEISDRTRWEQKNGLLKSQLDQEIATNELLKSKISSGLSQSETKQILKEQLLNDKNEEKNKDIKDGNNKEEAKKGIASSNNIDSNNEGSNKFENEE
jgi:hypothetical protein